MGHKQSYSWEFKLQMVQLLEKGDQNPGTDSGPGLKWNLTPVGSLVLALSGSVLVIILMQALGPLVAGTVALMGP